MQLKKISLIYYAVLKDKRGLSEETFETQAKTLNALYLELKARHGFPFSTKVLRVAVNDAFVTWDTPIQQGDKVVFIPPVAGG